jgi:tyrosine-protein kinase Etk/Wzc
MSDSIDYKKERHSVSGHSPQSQTIDLLDAWITLWSYKKVIILICFLGTTLSIGYSLMLPKQYVSQATFLPLSSGSKGVKGGLSGLASLAGISLPSSSNKIDFELILKSRSFTENVIRQLNLIPLIFEKSFDLESGKPMPAKSGFIKNLLSLIQAEDMESKALSDKKLKEQFLISRVAKIMKNGVVSISTDKKSGLITVEVTWKNARMAARIANKYIEELGVFLLNNSLTTTKKTRVFIEKQLHKTEKRLNEMEEKIKSFSERHGIFKVAQSASVVSSAIGRIKGEIALEEVKQNVLLQYQGEESPEVDLSKARLEALLQQLQALEKGGKTSVNHSYSDIPLSQLPSLGLAHARLERELIVQQEIYKLLRTQLETMKIEETKQSDSFQIIDQAVQPESPSKPNKRQIVILGGITSLFFSIFFIFFIEFIKYMKKENQLRKRRALETE